MLCRFSCDINQLLSYNMDIVDFVRLVQYVIEGLTCYMETEYQYYIRRKSENLGVSPNHVVAEKTG